MMRIMTERRQFVKNDRTYGWSFLFAISAPFPHKKFPGEISLWEWGRNFEKAPRFGAGKWSFHDILANAADKICPILEKLQNPGFK